MKDLKIMRLYLIALIDTLKHWFVSALTVFTAFVAPIGDLLIFVSILVVLDFITGIMAATYRGESRESNKMMRSVYKYFLYMMLLIVCHTFDVTTAPFLSSNIFSVFLSPEHLESVTKFKFFAAAAFIVIIREFKSVDENWKDVFGWSFIASGVLIYDGLISLLDKIKKLKEKDEEIRN